MLNSSGDDAEAVDGEAQGLWRDMCQMDPRIQLLQPKSKFRPGKDTNAWTFGWQGRHGNLGAAIHVCARKVDTCDIARSGNLLHNHAGNTWTLHAPSSG